MEIAGVEQISFQYPVWFILICIVAGLIYAAILYWKSKQLDGQPKWLKPLLGVLRFSIITLIGLLLLGPMLKSIIEESKAPSVIVLNDNSLSVGNWLNKQGSPDLHSEMIKLKSRLSEKYNVVSYNFGEDITLQEGDSVNYSAEITNINKAIKYVHDVYEGENLGALILVSDGIFNQGQNPLYTSIPSNIPIYSIALGDTTKQRDVSVQMVLHNEVAYLNDQMATQVDIRAFNAGNQTIRLSVDREMNGKFVNVASKNIAIRNDDFFTTEEIELTFNDIGINHYRYSVSSVSNEQNRSNNRKDIYVEVLDARQEIGIVAAAPHPDLGALKQLLEENKNYQVKTFFKDPSSSELSELDLVIFHDLPGRNRNLRTVLTSLDNRKTPRMYFVGSNTNLNQFNGLQSLVSISGNQGNSNDSQGELNTNFQNFTISEDLKAQIKRFPPVSSPFGEYEVNGSVSTLLYQSVGGISTDFPLLSFADVDGIKTSYFIGTDIWRWKLFDYLQNENFDLISELLDKSTVYVSTKEDKRKFRVSTNNNVYYTNEEIAFQGELYNNNYELVNDAEVTLQLIDANGNSFDYTFSKNNRSYVLDVGRLSAGSYRYNAETIFNGEQYEAKGRIVVREVQFELYDLEAQHNLLHALAQKTKGDVSYPNQVELLADGLLDSENIKPVVYQSVISKPLVDIKTLFFLLAALLGLEWILRRYYGSL